MALKKEKAELPSDYFDPEKNETNSDIPRIWIKEGIIKPMISSDDQQKEELGRHASHSSTASWMELYKSDPYTAVFGQEGHLTGQEHTDHSMDMTQVMDQNGSYDVPTYSRVPKGILRSFYDYVGKIGKTLVLRCRLCQCNQKSSGDATTNFHRHMRRKHKTEYFECKQQRESEAELSKPKDNNLNLDVQPKSNNSKSSKVISESQSLFYSENSPHNKELTNSLLKLITLDMCPLSVIEGRGFHEFVYKLDQRYRIPSKRSVQLGIEKKVEIAKKQQRKFLSRIPSTWLHITLDIWTNCDIETILGVRGHYISESWNLQRPTLAIKKINGIHSSEVVFDTIQAVLKDYNKACIDIGYCATINARSMMQAFQILDLSLQEGELDEGHGEEIEEVQIVKEFLRASEPEARVNGLSDDTQTLEFPFHRFPCVIYSFQLVLKKAIKNSYKQMSILKTIQEIVSFFYKSTFWSDELQKKTEGIGLLNHEVTRWDSYCLMLERFLKPQIFCAVSQVLTEARNTQGPGRNFVPNNVIIPRDHLVDLYNILRMFVDVTKRLEGNGVVSSLVIPLVFGISYKLSKLECNSVHKAFIHELGKGLLDHFCDMVNSKPWCLSTILDPQFKLQPFIDAEKQYKTNPSLLQLPSVDLVRNMVLDTMGTVKEEYGQSLVEKESNEESSADEAAAECEDILSFMSPPSKKAKVNNASMQLDEYLQGERQTGDATSFWRENEKKFPKLAMLSRKYLSLPATTSGVERIFSLTGALGKARRASLTPGMMEDIIICREYLK